MQWLQQWDDVLFLHYAADPEAIVPHLPAGLEVDTFDGQAWLSLVFFRLTLRPWGWPYVPGFSSLLELNVRTYVRYGGQLGIVFLRMYADNRLAIRAARLLTPLCYTFAEMSANHRLELKRSLRCQPRGTARKLEASFQLLSECQVAEIDSLDAWLVERYRLYAPSRCGELRVAEVEHKPWEIASIQMDRVEQSITDALNLQLADAPLAHYSPGVAATFHPFWAAKPVKPARLFRPARAAGRCAGR